MTRQLIGAEAARLLEGEGTKAKSVTSCDNAFVTNILLARSTRTERKRNKG